LDTLRDCRGCGIIMIERQQEQLKIINSLKLSEIVSIFERFIKSSPDLDRNNYSDYNSYHAEGNRISLMRQRALRQLNIFELLPLHKSTLAFFLSKGYSGRLSLKRRTNIVHLDYTAGQYYPTEYREACEVVLEWYNDKI